MSAAALKDLVNWNEAVQHHTARLRRLGFDVLRVNKLENAAFTGAWIDSAAAAVKNDLKANAMSREMLLNAALRRDVRMTARSEKASSPRAAITSSTAVPATRRPRALVRSPVCRPPVTKQVVEAGVRVRRLLSTPAKQAVTRTPTKQSVTRPAFADAPAAEAPVPLTTGVFADSPGASTHSGGDLQQEQLRSCSEAATSCVIPASGGVCDLALDTMRDAQTVLWHHAAQGGVCDLALETMRDAQQVLWHHAARLHPALPTARQPDTTSALSDTTNAPSRRVTAMPATTVDVAPSCTTEVPPAPSPPQHSVAAATAVSIDDALERAVWAAIDGTAAHETTNNISAALAVWRRHAMRARQSSLHGDECTGRHQQAACRRALRRLEAARIHSRQTRSTLPECTRRGDRALKRRACSHWRCLARAWARVALARYVQERRHLRRAVHRWRCRPTRRSFVSLVSVRSEIASLMH